MRAKERIYKSRGWRIVHDLEDAGRWEGASEEMDDLNFGDRDLARVRVPSSLRGTLVD